jgi:hypothetical protein
VVRENRGVKEPLPIVAILAKSCYSIHILYPQGRAAMPAPAFWKRRAGMKEKGPGLYLAMMIAGLAIAVGVFIMLVNIDFLWLDLVFYLPALAIAAFLIFFGKAKLKKK